MEEEKKQSGSRRTLTNVKIIRNEISSAEPFAQSTIDKMNRTGGDMSGIIEQLYKLCREREVTVISIRFKKRKTTFSQGGTRERGYAYVRGPPVLIRVGWREADFRRDVLSAFNDLIENNYDEVEDGFESVQLGQVLIMEESDVTTEYINTMLKKGVVQSKHQPINMLEGYCIQKFKALHTFSCMQEAIAIIFFYKYALVDDIDQLVYESIQKWRGRIFEMIKSFDQELIASLQTECPYTVIPLFNRWLKSKGYEHMVGVYQYVMVERDDFGEGNVQNYLIIYRQHVFPVTAYGLEVIERNQNIYIEKKQKMAERGPTKGVISYQLKSKLKQYQFDIENGSYSKYKDRSVYEQREVSHQRALKLCLQAPGESHADFVVRQMSWIEQRYKKFDRFTELGIDSETYTDNDTTGFMGHGNQIPYLICFAGKIQQQQENGQILIHDYNIDTNQSREEILAQAKAQSFWGIDCWEQFVKWIKRNRYYQSGYIGQRKLEIGGDYETKSKKYIKNNAQGVLRLQNYVVAHNGGRFDYGYLFSYLSQYIGIVDIVGTQSQIKALHCNNIYFYDTSLVHVGSLKDQCRAFLKECDWKKSVSEVVVQREEFLNMSEERKDEMLYYCLFDAHAVHKLHIAQFRDIYSKPFGHGFMQNKSNKGPFVHSSATLAMGIFQQQFLEVDLKAFPKNYIVEKLSMRGGHTQVYLPEMTLGICIDIKSSYPAAMYNLMPWEPKQKEMVGFERGKDVWELQFENYDLLAVNKFEFPPDISYPSCVIKVFQNGDVNGQYDIICPRKYEEKDSVLFMWGIEVKLARDLGAKIEIGGHLQYNPNPVFKKYIQKIFGLRCAWGENGEVIKYFRGDIMLQNMSEIGRGEVNFFYKELFEQSQPPALLIGMVERFPEKWERVQSYRKIQDKTCKLLMNSLFGKTGQKSYDKYMCGIVEDIYEAAYECAVFQQDQIQGDIYLQPVADYNIPLMQLTYRRKHQEIGQVGSLVRFASYITAVARCNLVSKMELIRGVLGEDRIVYCDTDSIFVQLKTWGDCEKFGREQQELLKMINEGDGNREVIEHVQEKLQKLIVCHPEYQRLLNVKVNDVRFVDDKTKYIEFIKMDQEVLGTFQLEKFVLEACFIASKAYCGYMMQNGNLNEVIKVKGVKIIDMKNASKSQKDNVLFQEKKEVIKLFREAHKTLMEGNFERCGFLVNSMNNFQRIGTMTSVHVRQKVCCHSLIKRRFEFVRGNLEKFPLCWKSYPHETLDDFFVAKSRHQEERKKLKEIIFCENSERVEEYEKDPGTIQIRQAIQTVSSNQKIINVRKNIFPVLFNEQFDNFPEFVKQKYLEKDEMFFDFVKKRQQQNYLKVQETEYKRSRLIHKMVRVEYIDTFHVHVVAACRTLFEYSKMIGFVYMKYLDSLDKLVADYLEFQFVDPGQKMLLKLRSLEHVYGEAEIFMQHLLTDFDKNLLMIVEEVSGEVVGVDIKKKVEKKFDKRIEKCRIVGEMKEILEAANMRKIAEEMRGVTGVGKVEQAISQYLLKILDGEQRTKLFGDMQKYSTHLPSGTKKLIKYMKIQVNRILREDRVEMRIQQNKNQREQNRVTGVTLLDDDVLAEDSNE